MLISLKPAKYGAFMVGRLIRNVKSLKGDAYGVLLGETAVIWQLIYKI